MTRKLKTFQTSLGFFDQAIAAPSMKAALEAWGAESNLFHQGIAKETTDPDIVAATMAAPGVVLKRPVGSSGEFKEHADLPTDIANNGGRRNDARRSADRKQGKRAKSSRNATSDRKAVFAYDREERRRDRKRAKEEAVREKDRERRQAAIDAAQEALESARKEYEADVAKIQIEIEALEKRAETQTIGTRKNPGLNWRFRGRGSKFDSRPTVTLRQAFVIAQCCARYLQPLSARSSPIRLELSSPFGPHQEAETQQTFEIDDRHRSANRDRLLPAQDLVFALTRHLVLPWLIWWTSQTAQRKVAGSVACDP